MDYYELLQKVLYRYFIKEVLDKIVKYGLEDNQVLYIIFDPSVTGVKLPNFVQTDSTGKVTIVLQFQFWNLKVYDDYFSVDLRFDGALHTIEVPFQAICDFIDPNHKFRIAFSSKGDPDFDEFEYEEEDNLIKVDFNNYNKEKS